MPTASLPMYNMPEVRHASDALWAGLARHLRAEGLDDVPDSLLYDRPVSAIWTDPDMLFSQACGFDLMKNHVGHLQPLATPCYAVPGCVGGTYKSVVIVHADAPAQELEDLRGTVCAINGYGSHSGMNALRDLVAPLSRQGRFFAEVIVSGAHFKSVAAVAERRADTAAIDCVGYAMLGRHRPDAIADIRVIAETASAPALPFVTRADTDANTVDRLRAALTTAMADPDISDARDTLLLESIESLPDDAYDDILEFERRAASFGYPTLR